MDDTRFDTITRQLTAAPSRRRLLAGLVGGVATVLAGAALTSDGAEAKPGRGNANGNGRGRDNGNGRGNGNGRDNGNGRGNGNGNGPGNGRGRGQNKITFCHRSDEGFHQITVAEPARKAHLGHGDVECVEDPCKVYTGACDQTTGACAFEPATGAECGDGGVCDESGSCVVIEE